MPEKIKTMAEKCREMAEQSANAEGRAFWSRMANYWDRPRQSEDDTAVVAKIAVG